MPGLSLGAAQQYDIPADLQCYERIAGIEFIETRAGIPYPRSAAYRPCAGGAQMRVRDGAPDILDADLTEGEARAYIAALVEAGLFRWRRVYRPAQGTFVLDGTNWRVEVTFTKDGGLRAPRPLRAEGEGLFPDGYDHMTGLLMALPERVRAELAAPAESAQTQEGGEA